MPVSRVVRNDQQHTIELVRRAAPRAVLDGEQDFILVFSGLAPLEHGHCRQTKESKQAGGIGRTAATATATGRGRGGCYLDARFRCSRPAAIVRYGETDRVAAGRRCAEAGAVMRATGLVVKVQ